MDGTRRQLKVITQVRPDLTAFERGAICADFDEDCFAMPQDLREACAAGFPYDEDFETDYVGPCPYVKGAL